MMTQKKIQNKGNQLMDKQIQYKGNQMKISLQKDFQSRGKHKVNLSKARIRMQINSRILEDLEKSLLNHNNSNL